MDRKHMDRQLEQRIEDVERKMNLLKNELLRQDNAEPNGDIKLSLKSLDEKSKEIREMYQDLINKTITDKLKFDEFEKNIYTSIQAFNNAYRKAGSLFEQR